MCLYWQSSHCYFPFQESVILVSPMMFFTGIFRQTAVRHALNATAQAKRPLSKRLIPPNSNVLNAISAGEFNNSSDLLSRSRFLSVVLHRESQKLRRLPVVTGELRRNLYKRRLSARPLLHRCPARRGPCRAG